VTETSPWRCVRLHKVISYDGNGKLEATHGTLQAANCPKYQGQNVLKAQIVGT
jgi:hypothetical protein